MRRFENFIIVLSGCLLLGAPSAMAEEGGLKSGFFEKNSVRGVFGEHMKEVAAVPYEYFVPTPRVEEPAPAAAQQGTRAQKAAAPAQPQNAAPLIPAANAFTPEVELQNTELSPFIDPASEEAKNDPVAQSLLQAYGDPDKEAPVKAVDNAPTPFKAMMAALEANREDLAMKYARQYVRHVKNVQTRSQKVMGLAAKALENEGKEASQEDEAANLIKGNQDIDAEAKALVEKVARGQGLRQDTEAFGFQDRNSGVKATGNLVSEAKEREEARSVLSGKVPVDPQGKVDVYFFFDPSDAAGIQMVKEIETLYRMSRSRGDVNLAGMTLKPLAPAQEKALRDHTGASYPITDGTKLYQILKLSGSPVTVLVTRSTAESRIESGLKRAVYLDELLKLMEGRKA